MPNELWTAKMPGHIIPIYVIIEDMRVNTICNYQKQNPTPKY